MKDFIFWSTILSIFSESLLVHYGIDIRFYYLIVLFNMFCLCSFYEVRFQKEHIIVIFILLLSGVFSIIRHSTTVGGFLFQFSGITIVSAYYALFFKWTNKSGSEIFKIYCQLAYYLSAIGLILFLVKLGMGRFEPVRSIMAEPSHFAGIILPAYYYFFKNISSHRKEFFVIILALILSGSSIGLVCALAGLFILPQRINLVRIFLPLCVGLSLGVGLYFVMPDFKLRIDDTFNSLVKQDVEGANLSTYALVSNLYVASENFKEHYLIGGGLGSHEVAHSKFIQTLPGVEFFEFNMTLNSKDANSFLIRVISECGLIGIFLIGWFLVGNYSKTSYVISRAILLYFSYKLIREGHYFPPELYFFVFLYFTNKQENNIQARPEADIKI